MNIIDKKLYKLNPVYLVEYENLIKSHSQFGGGATEDKFIQAKSFSSVYEFYIYAFFIGLYKNKKVEIISEDKTKSFWEMDNWKPKELVDYLIICAIAESEFDMVAIEQMDEKGVSKHIKLLKDEIEKYANGGLRYINDRLEEDPELKDDDMFFISLLSEAET